MRQGSQDASAVPRVGLAPARAAMIHAQQHCVGIPDDLVSPLSLDVSDETDSTTIFFKRGIVQALLGWQSNASWFFHNTPVMLDGHLAHRVIVAGRAPVFCLGRARCPSCRPIIAASCRCR